MENKKRIKLHQKIYKYFKGNISSQLIQDCQIDINFKHSNFILGRDDFKFLDSFGYKFDSLISYDNQRGITIVLTK